MKVLWHILVICFFASALYCAEVISIKNNNCIRTEGEHCILKNNKQGICRKVERCEYVLKLVSERKFSEITRCKFENQIRFVCCPKVVKTTTQPSQQYPKSKNFVKVLCQNKTVNVLLLNLNQGDLAGVGEFPHQVALGYLKPDNVSIEYKCGGSLIADDVVLTSALCANSKPITVKLGRVSLIKNDNDTGVGEDREIQSIKVHHDYISWRVHDNDVALIKLKHPTNLTWPIQTVCLSLLDDIDVPKKLIVTGFGRSFVDTRKESDWLLKATVKKSSLDECKGLMSEMSDSLSESQFCAIGPKSCHGDSGSPLIYQYENIQFLHGVMSYKTGCGSNSSGIYTKVGEYLRWIDDVMYGFERNKF